MKAKSKTRQWLAVGVCTSLASIGALAGVLTPLQALAAEVMPTSTSLSISPKTAEVLEPMKAEVVISGDAWAAGDTTTYALPDQIDFTSANGRTLTLTASDGTQFNVVIDAPASGPASIRTVMGAAGTPNYKFTEVVTIWGYAKTMGTFPTGTGSDNFTIGAPTGSIPAPTTESLDSSVNPDGSAHYRLVTRQYLPPRFPQWKHPIRDGALSTMAPSQHLSV